MVKIFFKKWVFIFCIMVFSFIIGLKSALSFFYLFFIACSSIICLSFFCVLAGFLGSKLLIIRKITESVNEDEAIEIEAIIKNEGVLSIFDLILKDDFSNLSLHERGKSVPLGYLKKDNTVTIKYRCACHHRGKYKIGPFLVYFFDPLGLFFFKKVYYVYSEVYVQPKTFNIVNFPFLSKGVLPWFGINTDRSCGDEDEFFAVREYKEGDHIKRVHWISTARKNKLMVKQFQSQSFFRASIIFSLEKDKNFGEDRDCVAEYIIRIAASVAKYLTEKDVSLEVIAHTGEITHIPFNRGTEHLNNIFKFLAVAQVESRVNLGEIFEEFQHRVLDDTTLIIIASDTDWEYLPALLSLEKRNVSLVPLILISSTFLHSFKKEDAQKAISGAKAQLVEVLNYSPIFFSRGDNLEENFTKLLK